MEIRLLRTFKEVAEAGSFTHAASRVHLTQSAVSVHIRQLEEELGTPLFLRVNRKVYLTDAGKLLLERAEKILREHDEAKSGLSAIIEPSRGRLHIGVASTAITVHPLPEILGEIKRRFSSIDMVVAGGTSEWIIEQILAGETDVGLVSLPVESTDVMTETLRSDPLVAAMTPQHRLARSRRITARELAAEPLILGEKGGNTRRLIDLFFEKSRLEPEIVMELQRTEAIIKMVELGFGLTILPQGSLHASVERQSLRAVAVRDLNLRWEFGLAYLKSDYQPPAVEAFLELCRSHIGGTGGRNVSGE